MPILREKSRLMLAVERQTSPSAKARRGFQNQKTSFCEASQARTPAASVWRHYATRLCHSGVGAPESRRSYQNNVTSKAGAFQAEPAKIPSQGISPKAWIPGPCVLAHASRNDTAAEPSGKTAQNAVTPFHSFTLSPFHARTQHLNAALRIASRGWRADWMNSEQMNS